jgi:osmoprotectant transport system ATP-binding protein
MEHGAERAGHAGSAAPGIELAGLTVRFGATLALDALDLSIDGARTTALIGPSGCGKTTFLRLCIGLQLPTRGTVRVLGDELRPDTLAALRHRIGYVVQEGGLFPHLTCADNAALVARHLGWDKPRVRERMDELCELVHLERATLERFPRELSGGQRQRVGLMRALFLDPELLLLDEPLGSLDPMIRSGLQNELKSVFARLGKTVVVVTHDLFEAGLLGDDILLFQSGRVAQRGDLAALVRAPANDFVRDFVRAQRGPLELLEGRS